MIEYIFYTSFYNLLRAIDGEGHSVIISSLKSVLYCSETTTNFQKLYLFKFLPSCFTQSSETHHYVTQQPLLVLAVSYVTIFSHASC